MDFRKRSKSNPLDDNDACIEVIDFDNIFEPPSIKENIIIRFFNWICIKLKGINHTKYMRTNI
jgi:hypothetical protein